MLSQLFMAKSAYFSYERKMQVIANNIANAQTVGFKKKRMEMESLFPLVLERAYSEFDEVSPGAGRKRKKYLEYGQGIRIVDITKDFSTGSIEMTNQQLDVAIEGKGFFQFLLPDGTFGFSRAGNLHMDAEGNVLNPNGHPLDPAITVPANTTEIIINEAGEVFAQTPENVQPTEIGQVYLVNFPNPGGLKDIGQNLFRSTAASGDPELTIPGENGVGMVKQRALEFSNVNIIEEMMNMLLCQRTFELVNSTIKSADSMLKAASDIGK